jgi:hypothetical protein
VAVVTRSAAVCSKMVKLIRSVSKPGRVAAVSADECLVDGQQRPGLLVGAGQAAGAQDPAVEDGGLDRVVGGLGLPALVVEGDQLGGGVGQAGEQAPLLGAGGAVGQGDGDRGVDDPDREKRREDAVADPGQVGPVGQVPQWVGQRRAAERTRNCAPVPVTSRTNSAASNPASASSSMVASSSAPSTAPA